MSYKVLGVGVGLLFMIGMAKAVEDRPAEHVKIKSDRPHTGSNIKHDAGSWYVPVDKSYEQLTVAQQDIVRSFYEEFPIWDEPPFPKYGMQGILNSIRSATESLRLRGSLFAVAHVDVKGVVTTVSFYETPDPDLAKAIAFILYKEKFKPAVCSGEPCEMDFPLKMQFDYRYR